jgi:hypothetical protein
MSKRKQPRELKLTIVRPKAPEQPQPLSDRIGDLHAELCEIMSLINVTAAALPSMADQGDLAEPQSVLRGAGDRISAAMDELEVIATKVRAV